MTLPGFTAQDSLAPATQSYRTSGGHPAPQNSVVPQNLGCRITETRCFGVVQYVHWQCPSAAGGHDYWEQRGWCIGLWF